MIIGGDGRADSPGHSAKFGSYTVFDLKQKSVIDIELVEVSVIMCTILLNYTMSNEVKNSNQMEKEGLIRAIDDLQEEGLTIGTLVTDRHNQIAKWMREEHPEIDHRYDVWHVAKCMLSKCVNYHFHVTSYIHL